MQLSKCHKGKRLVQFKNYIFFGLELAQLDEDVLAPDERSTYSHREPETIPANCIASLSWEIMFWINCIIVIVLLIVLSCMLLFSSPKIVNIAVTVFYAIPKFPYAGVTLSRNWHQMVIRIWNFEFRTKMVPEPHTKLKQVRCLQKVSGWYPNYTRRQHEDVKFCSVV